MELDLIKTGASDYKKLVRMVVAGPSGTGKTRFAATAPNPVWGNARAGLMSIADKAIPYVDIFEEKDIFKLKFALEGDADTRRQRFGQPVDTLVIDTLDELQRVLLAERLLNERRLETTASDYGWLGQKMHSIFEAWDELPVHLIVICHTKDVVDGDSGRLFIKPGLQGAFADQMGQYVDFALLANQRLWKDQETGVTTRDFFLSSYQTNLIEWTKDLSGQLPEQFTLNFNDDFSRIQALIESGAPSTEAEKITTEIADDQRLEDAADIRVAADKARVIEQDAPTPVQEQPSENAIPCTTCSGGVNPPWDELSKIRYNRVLCQECFTKRKNQE